MKSHNIFNQTQISINLGENADQTEYFENITPDEKIKALTGK